MTLAILTSPEAVNAAVEEFDQLGRDRFLSKYGFGGGQVMLRTRTGNDYDAAPVLAAAVGFEHPQRGPLRANEFNAAPDAIGDKLIELGFAVVDPYSDDDVQITARDIELISSARVKAARGLRYADLDQGERDAFSRTHHALEVLGELTAAELGHPEDVSLKLTSGFHPRGGIRGYVPRDLWFAVSPSDAAKALAGNPQLFMIVSERGIEYGFGASVHPNDFSNQGIKDKVRQTAPIVFSKLPKPRSKEAEEIGNAISRSGNWYYRKKHRLDTNQSEFAELDDWLAFLHSPAGANNAAGGICRYLGGNELDTTDLAAEVKSMASLFEPLLMRDWLSQHQEAPLLTNTITDERSGAEPVTRGFADRFERFLAVFENKRKSKFGIDAELRDAVRELESWIAATPAVKQRPDIKVTLSVGKGNWANIPWIALIDRRVTTTTQEGVYIVFLISEDLQVTYLTLNQGMTALVQAFGQRGAAEEMVRVGNEARMQLGDLSQQGFALDNQIDLRSSGKAKNYEIGTIAHHEMKRSVLPDDGEVCAHLENLLSAYEKVVTEKVPSVSAWNDDPDSSVPAAPPPAYGVDDAMSELFIERDELERILTIWRSKMNLILQGAPGVGKSYLAKRLAYALVGARDESAIEAVQFHQSYSYEDFVRGFRPDGSGGFELQDGIFLRFVEAARQHPSTPYVLIIDEINRGNLSKIFGELMLLIEADKRSPEWATRLAYPRYAEGRFFIPDNVYLIGMMNTADRSLSLVDYALRRRFGFVTAEPQFASPAFAEFLADKNVPSDIIDRIRVGMGELNEAIATDRINLGPGFRIGHSFFTPREDVENAGWWYQSIIDTEIAPLLEEYWFDNPDRADEWRNRLTA